MIYGRDFNNTHIPAGIKRLFRAELKRWMEPDMSGYEHEVVLPRGHWARLGGVAQSLAELDIMRLAANNGQRKLHVVARKVANGETWWGVYVYYADVVRP